MATDRKYKVKSRMVNNVKLKKTIKLFLSVILLAYIAYYIANNTDEFLKLKDIKWHQILQMYVVTCLLLCVIGVRLLNIMRVYGLKQISFIEWVRIYMLARFFNYFVPQAGSIYRAVKLKEEYGFTYLKYLTSFLAFTWMDAITILLTVSMMLFVFEKTFIVAGIPAYLLSLASLLLVIFIPITFSLLAKGMFNEQSALSKTLYKFSSFIDVMNSPVLILKQLALSILSFLLYVYLLYICSISISVEIPISMLVIFSAIIKLSTYIVITPGNIGINELALGYLSIGSNLEFGDGIMISGISRLIIYISTITLGCIFGGIPMVKELFSYDNNLNKGIS